MTKEELIAFEDGIIEIFHAGKLPFPIHYSGGNEDILIELFKNIKKEDWVFSTWRSHYHYLLKGGSPEVLKNKIMHGDSMHIMDENLKFMASSIVAGCCPIAVGVAKSLQMRKAAGHVWVFIGDGCEDEGIFYESVRYVAAWGLPCTFIIEDNGLSVDTTLQERMNGFTINWPDCVKRYHYIRKWPHCQSGRFIKEYM